MNISGAIQALQEGCSVYREGWHGKDMWLELQKPDEDSKMSLPYVFIVTPEGDTVPWVCSQTDLLADDWHIISLELEEEEE